MNIIGEIYAEKAHQGLSANQFMLEHSALLGILDAVREGTDFHLTDEETVVLYYRLFKSCMRGALIQNPDLDLYRIIKDFKGN